MESLWTLQGRAGGAVAGGAAALRRRGAAGGAADRRVGGADHRGEPGYPVPAAARCADRDAERDLLQRLPDAAGGGQGPGAAADGGAAGRSRPVQGAARGARAGDRGRGAADRGAAHPEGAAGRRLRGASRAGRFRGGGERARRRQWCCGDRGADAGGAGPALLDPRRGAADQLRHRGDLALRRPAGSGAGDGQRRDRPGGGAGGGSGKRAVFPRGSADRGRAARGAVRGVVAGAGGGADRAALPAAGGFWRPAGWRGSRRWRGGTIRSAGCWSRARSWTSRIRPI